MLRKHLPAIAAIHATPALSYRVRQYFGLGPRHLITECREHELCHADIVLCLIRINTPRALQIVTSLLGKPITIGPACRLTWPDNRQLPLVRTQPTICAVHQDIVVRRRTRLHSCLSEFKIGRTWDQLLQRGVRRADIRRAVRKGIIQLAEAR
jgi:hypothetical protein